MARRCALVADVTQEASVAAAFEAAVAAWGALDVVVVNAGIEMLGSDTRVHELDAAVWDRIIAVNLTGQFHASKHGIRALATGRRWLAHLHRVALRRRGLVRTRDRLQRQQGRRDGPHPGHGRGLRRPRGSGSTASSRASSIRP